ncbi:MAG: iron-sulfur cluster assembly accessory protein [Deltaproteobacteria bacterium]|nr:iron-sulfur cluster assembly accessory protein [Deltaproteobacteria bacterium]
MMNLTSEAVQRVKELVKQNNKEGYGLRIGVVSGGCSGLSYKMDFEEAPNEKDRVIECDGVKIFVDPKAYLYLQNVEVGFHSDLVSSSFTFNNPDAKATCGCGTSFAV